MVRFGLSSDLFLLHTMNARRQQQQPKWQNTINNHVTQTNVQFSVEVSLVFSFFFALFRYLSLSVASSLRFEYFLYMHFDNPKSFSNFEKKNLFIPYQSNHFQWECANFNEKCSGRFFNGYHCIHMQTCTSRQAVGHACMHTCIIICNIHTLQISPIRKIKIRKVKWKNSEKYSRGIDREERKMR